jgi:hypothetical protein
MDEENSLLGSARSASQNPPDMRDAGGLQLNIPVQEELGEIDVIDQEAKPLDTEQVVQLRDIFDYFDLDGKGKLTAGSLKQVFAEMGLTYSLAQCGEIVATHGNAFEEAEQKHIDTAAAQGDGAKKAKAGHHHPGIAFEDFLVFFAKVSLPSPFGQY